MQPHEKQRFKERSAVERFNGRLKEEFGGNNVMVKGAEKVTLHLMLEFFQSLQINLSKLLPLETVLLQEAPYNSIMIPFY